MKCDCKDGVWSVTQGKCFNCMSGWILIRKTCYRVSNDFPSGIVFSNLKDRPDIVVSMCYNEPTAKIARLNDANVNAKMLNIVIIIFIFLFLNAFHNYFCLYKKIEYY